MKVSITMSENFDWGYNEAETNEHLIVVEKTKVALEKFAKGEDTNIFDDEASNAQTVLGRMGRSLFYYALDKNYNLSPYFDACNNEEAKREKSDDLEIDESQFEVPNQSQKTL